MNRSGQDDSGFKKLLTFSRFYEFFQARLLGGNSARRWLVTNVWKVKVGETIIDIGCGPGSVLNYLPQGISYWGVDISDDYIRSASRKFSARGIFFLGTARDFLNHDGSHLHSADLVLCNGLLHHLSDEEAIEVLTLSKELLKPHGRLVCLEATFLLRQTRLSRWIVSTDRGRHVRSERDWKNLVNRVFDVYSTSIVTGLIRMPYTHIIIECANE